MAGTFVVSVSRTRVERGGGRCLGAFVDSDFASRATDRRSVSEGVVMCAGASISFLSRTQKSVSLSSTEAKYVAMGDGLKQAISG